MLPVGLPVVSRNFGTNFDLGDFAISRRVSTRVGAPLVRSDHLEIVSAMYYIDKDNVSHLCSNHSLPGNRALVPRARGYGALESQCQPSPGLRRNTDTCRQTPPADSICCKSEIWEYLAKRHVWIQITYGQ